MKRNSTSILKHFFLAAMALAVSLHQIPGRRALAGACAVSSNFQNLAQLQKKPLRFRGCRPCVVREKETGKISEVAPVSPQSVFTDPALKTFSLFSVDVSPLSLTAHVFQSGRSPPAT